MRQDKSLMERDLMTLVALAVLTVVPLTADEIQDYMGSAQKPVKEESQGAPLGSAEHPMHVLVDVEPAGTLGQAVRQLQIELESMRQDRMRERLEREAAKHEAAKKKKTPKKLVKRKPKPKPKPKKEAPKLPIGPEKDEHRVPATPPAEADKSHTGTECVIPAVPHDGKVL